MLGPTEHFAFDIALFEDVFYFLDDKIDEVVPLVQLLIRLRNWWNASRNLATLTKLAAVCMNWFCLRPTLNTTLPSSTTTVTPTWPPLNALKMSCALSNKRLTPMML